MKTILIFLILIPFAGNILAQGYRPYRQLSLPLLKESYKIDSLLDIIIRQTTSNKTGFSFDIIERSHSYFYDIAQWKRQDSTLYTSLPVEEYLKEAGYFTYKGYTVIVFGDKDRYNLFERTNKMRSFNFIPSEERRDLNAFGACFEYHDGKFSWMRLYAQ